TPTYAVDSFPTRRSSDLQPRQLPVYALLGIVCGLVGAIYPKVFYGVRDRIFRPLKIPAWMKPALGAVVVGAIAVYFPQALGMGRSEEHTSELQSRGHLVC